MFLNPNLWGVWLSWLGVSEDADYTVGNVLVSYLILSYLECSVSEKMVQTYLNSLSLGFGIWFLEK